MDTVVTCYDQGRALEWQFFFFLVRRLPKKTPVVGGQQPERFPGYNLILNNQYTKDSR